MKKRVITGLIMAIILVPALIFPQLTSFTQVLLMLIVMGASYELTNMYSKEKKLHPALIVLTMLLTLVFYFSIMIAFQPTFDYLHNQGAMPDSKNYRTIIYRVFSAMKIVKVINPVTVVAIIFIILMASMVFISDFTVPDVGKLFTSIIYVGICAGSFTVLWFTGVRLIVYLLIITTATDIFALVFGMLLGKHKMAPNISPKKTWEGAIGGSCVAVVLGCLFLLFYEYIAMATGQVQHKNFFEGIFPFDTFTPIGKMFFGFVLTLSISICSQIGDLIASKLKRNYGIKDYSNIFPGHGGILDRFDSVFFASAIFLVILIVEQNMFGMYVTDNTIGSITAFFQCFTRMF